MEPQVWVPWLLALCAPAALLLSQWMSNRERARDRDAEQGRVDQAREEGRGQLLHEYRHRIEDHWRNERLGVYTNFLRLVSRQQVELGLSNPGENPYLLTSKPLLDLQGACFSVQMIGQSDTASTAVRLVRQLLAIGELHREIAAGEAEGADAGKAWAAFNRTVSYFVHHARVDLGVMPPSDRARIVEAQEGDRGKAWLDHLDRPSTETVAPWLKSPTS